HAIEDLPDVESINDEIDRTMLINTVRSEMLRLDTAVHGPTADPGLPLRHAVAALDALMGEDFDAEREAALRARLQELPAFLAGLREEKRPESSFLVDAAQRTALELA